MDHPYLHGSPVDSSNSMWNSPFPLLSGKPVSHQHQPGMNGETSHAHLDNVQHHGMRTEGFYPSHQEEVHHFMDSDGNINVNADGLNSYWHNPVQFHQPSLDIHNDPYHYDPTQNFHQPDHDALVSEHIQESPLHHQAETSQYQEDVFLHLPLLNPREVLSSHFQGLKYAMKGGLSNRLHNRPQSRVDNQKDQDLQHVPEQSQVESQEKDQQEQSNALPASTTNKNMYGRFDKYEWQKLLSEENVLQAILTIAAGWPRASKDSNRRFLDRMNAYLDQHLLLVEPILHNKKQAIEEVRQYSMEGFLKNRPKSERYETWDALLEWLKSSTMNLGDSSRKRPKWAPIRTSFQSQQRFVDVVHKATMKDRISVKKMLYKLGSGTVTKWFNKVLDEDKSGAYAAALQMTQDWEHDYTLKKVLNRFNKPSTSGHRRNKKYIDVDQLDEHPSADDQDYFDQHDGFR